jgi:preprotein translocase subunit YajC
MFAMWLQSMAGLGSMGSLALPILFFVVLYFLMIAPNQKKQKKWQEMLSQLKSGDRVTTNGGLRGTVLSVKDDVVVLRIQPDGVKLEFVRRKARRRQKQVLPLRGRMTSEKQVENEPLTTDKEEAGMTAAGCTAAEPPPKRTWERIWPGNRHSSLRRW